MPGPYNSWLRSNPMRVSAAFGVSEATGRPSLGAVPEVSSASGRELPTTRDTVIFPAGCAAGACAGVTWLRCRGQYSSRAGAVPVFAGVGLKMVALKDIGHVAAAILLGTAGVPGGAIEVVADQLTGSRIVTAFGAQAGLPACYEALPLSVVSDTEDWAMFRWFAQASAYPSDLAAVKEIKPTVWGPARIDPFLRLDRARGQRPSLSSAHAPRRLPAHAARVRNG